MAGYNVSTPESRQRRKVASVLLVGAAFLILAVFGLVSAAFGGSDGGTIEGKVTFAGTPSPPEIVEVGQDREVCGSERLTRSLQVRNGGVKNAVVRLVDIEATDGEFSIGEPVLDQNGCEFVPRVLVIAPGELTVLNSDGILHNVHLYPEKSRPKNLAMPRYLRKKTLSFQVPEQIEIKCDAHGWMRAYVVVAEHPYYAVTDEEGRFRLTDVPAGTYTLEVWQEALGTQTGTVTVREGGTVRMDLSYKAEDSS